MIPAGFRLHSAYLDHASQQSLAREILELAKEAPFYRPFVPSGKPMSVEMTNFGPLGWITDAKGYRYEALHPVTGRPWPAIPQRLLQIWAELADASTPPDACLVNRYGAASRMGPHRDADEANFRIPVLSVSLGDAALFRIGGPGRRDPMTKLRLASGDVCVLAGDARLAYHGVDRIFFGDSRLIPGGGRINLTLRRASPAAS